MPSELAIVALAGGVFAFVFMCYRPSSDAAQPSRLAVLCGRIRSRMSRVVALRDCDRADRTSFRYGVVTGLVFAMCCNLVPFFYTYGAYRTDGFEVIGFPLIFRSAGGFLFSTQFYPLAFLADLTFASVVSVVGGYAGFGIRSMFASRRKEMLEKDEMSK